VTAYSLGWSEALRAKSQESLNKNSSLRSRRQRPNVAAARFTGSRLFYVNDPGVALAKPRFTPGYTLAPASQAKGNSLAPASQAKEKFKSSGGFWPPELDKVTLDESVTVTQSELNQASGNDGRCDLTKRSRRSDVDTSRETKDRMVPHIEHIHAETKVMRFLDPDVLD